MRKEELRIIFMGTPDFAVESLRSLVEGGYNIVAVVTMPDKPVGRHQTELSQSAVKQYALSQGLLVLQPEKLKDEDFIETLRQLKADLQIVVAFRMLPEIVWSMPPHGTFNLHASLLPQYRGAAPINWAIINGDSQTGITTFFLDHTIDTGAIIQRVAIPIGEDDNAEVIHDRLMHLGAKLVCETVDNILADSISPISQTELCDESEIRHAPKIFKETCRIHWQQDTKRCHNFVRGLSPYPAAWTELCSPDGKRRIVKIYTTKKEYATHSAPIGSVISDGKTFFKIALTDGYLQVHSLQIAGKKRMAIDDFLRGFPLKGDWYVE